MPRRSPHTPIFENTRRRGSIGVGSQLGSPQVLGEVNTSWGSWTADSIGVVIGTPGSVTPKGFNADASSTASNGSLVFAATIAFSLGDWIVVTVAAKNAGTSGVSSTTTMSDAQGNTYTKRVDETCNHGAANDGITLSMFTAPIATALSTGDNITVNFSPNTGPKAVTVFRVRPASGKALSFITSGSVSVPLSSSTTITTSSLALNDYVIGGLAREDRDGPNQSNNTTNGSWSSQEAKGADAGVDSASAMSASQYKIMTGFGATTYDPSGITAGGQGVEDNAVGYVVLRQS